MKIYIDTGTPSLREHIYVLYDDNEYRFINNRETDDFGSGIINFKLKVDDGFKFIKPGDINLNLISNYIEPIDFDDYSITFEVDESKYPFNRFRLFTMEPEFIEQDESTTIEKLPYTKIYTMSYDEMNELSEYSYTLTKLIGSGDIGDIVIPFGDFISSLYAFPYKIESENEKEKIRLGTNEIDVRSKPLDNYMYKIGLGEIKIEYVDNLNVGFSNIDIELFVPFFNSISLNPELVICEKISMNLLLNVMTVIATLNVLNQKTTSVIHSEYKQIGVEIPYRIGEKLDLGLTKGILETDFNKPYVQLKILKPDNKINLLDSRIMFVSSEWDYVKDNGN